MHRQPDPGTRPVGSRHARAAHASADALVILVGFWLAYVLRYQGGLGGRVSGDNFRPFQDFLPLTALLGVIALAVFIVRGVYQSTPWTGLFDEALLIGSSMVISFGILTAFVFYAQVFTFSRLTFLYALVLNTVLLIGKWLAWLWLSTWTLSRKYQTDRALDIALATAILLMGIVPMLLLPLLKRLDRSGWPDVQPGSGGSGRRWQRRRAGTE
jgi:FlaA1/EpsC-like NDP-sugar epimerase